jgi:transposase
MANKPITMLRLRRIIQLKERGYSNREIAGKLHLARDTVNDYVNRILSCGKNNTELLKLNEEQLALLVFEVKPEPIKDDRYLDLQSRMGYFSDELKKPKTTRQILWEEYIGEVPGGYSRSQFCEHLIRYLNSRKAVMHFEHEPGALMEFDFAGDPLYYVDVATGELIKCPVLVCRLPCSGYTYTEALVSQRREHLITALGRALSYFGGVPQEAKTDNMKQFVKKANRYEPRFDVLAEQWALHYDTTLTATRVRKPRDKAGVESGVNTTYYRIYAPLRNKTFIHLTELNQAISKENEKLNRHNFQGLDYSRHDKFTNLEKPCLRPLPETAFVIKNSQSAKVGPNYHVKLSEDDHFYSVPDNYITHRVVMIYDTENVEIYLGNHHRIACHKRDYTKKGYTTLTEHMPAAHRYYHIQQGWNQEYFLDKAGLIGENTLAAMKVILKQKIIVEQTYQSCKGTLRLVDKYGQGRLEAACGRALLGSKISYTLLNNILSRNLDKAPLQTAIEFNIPEHVNIRGSHAFE